MALPSLAPAATEIIAASPLAQAADHSLASHAHLAALVDGGAPDIARDLCDAVHLLCSLYGSHPGLVDIAQSSCPTGPARKWLASVTEQFERERLYLVRLTAAIGPLPSTPAAAETEAALMAQRHALETLAQSERRGCSVGAVAALLVDWRALRPLLDRGARRVGMDIPASHLPDAASIGPAIAATVDGVAMERAMRFGAEQLVLQHRGLFDLLEARAAARLLA